MKKGFYLFGIALGVTALVLFLFFNQKTSVFFQGSGGPVVPVQPDSLSYVPGLGKNPLTTQKQFELFPLPQFALNHSLNANFLWMDPSFLGGSGQPDISPAGAVANSVFIQEQLAGYWNYSVMVNNNTKIFNKYKEPSSFIYAWVKLANEHPEWPAAAITFWGQVRPRHLNDSACNGDRGYIGRTNLPDSMYLHFEPGDNHKTKRINPAVHSDNFNCDGLTQQKYVRELLSALKRPLNYINENGEVFHLIASSKLEQDKRVQADMKRYPGLNTYQYQSKKRLELELKYKNYFMSDPLLSQTHYSVYSIDGFEKYRHDYAYLRKIQSPLRGMHYSTPDFYPRWPNNWRRMQGPWHGLEWIEICREKEMSFGDHLFSPFVAAGWDKDETINIPPGQWLGLLKILQVFGAEFFYTGYFNEKMPPNDPRQYGWQSVMPAYAQAVFSHFPEVLLEGVTQKENQFFLETGRKDVVALVRKRKQKEQYLLTLTLQHSTNDKNNPHEVETDLVWKGKKIKVKAREQGSVYLIDLSQPTSPRIIFLDEWHQWMHPSRWEKEHWMNPVIANNPDRIQSLFPKDHNQWDLTVLQNVLEIKPGEECLLVWQKRSEEKPEELVLDLGNIQTSSKAEIWEGEERLGVYELKPGLNTIKIQSSKTSNRHSKLSLRSTNGKIVLKKWKMKCSKN